MPAPMNSRTRACGGGGWFPLWRAVGARSDVHTRGWHQSSCAPRRAAQPEAGSRAGVPCAVSGVRAMHASCAAGVSCAVHGMPAMHASCAAEQGAARGRGPCVVSARDQCLCGK
eukprot:180255-Chlamydomonas_euryale.AAC.4